MPKAPLGARRASNPSYVKGSKPAAGKSAGKGGPKQRWTSDQRVAKGHAAERPRGGDRDGARDGARDGGRGAERGGQRDGGFVGRTGKGQRPNWEPRKPVGDRFDRTERPSRDRNDRGDRPSYDRNDRGARTERPAYSRDDRGARTERPAYNRDDRGARTERPAYNRDDRGARTERPAYNRDDRGARTERPAYNRDDRAPRTERPAYNRDDRAPRTERPAYARPDRNDRPERPRQDRSDRPSRDNTTWDRPRVDRSDRPDRPDRREGTDRVERPGRGGFDRTGRNAGFDRPRRDDERPRRDFGTRDDRAPRNDWNAPAPRPAFHDDVVLERLQGAAVQASDVEGTTFADLGLGSNIVRELETLGATNPFAIQAATIPDVLAGHDVLGRGRTGSGKTIAFGAPLVERLLKLRADLTGTERRRPGRAPRAIILAPTRELALQIDRTVQPIARSVGLFTTQLYGGVPYARQYGALSRGVDIIVGTPGRIGDLVSQGRLDLSDIAITVLDEADHMCDLGFLEPVQDLLRRMPKDSQKLLFSATLDSGVATLVDEFLIDPTVHEVAGEDAASSTIEHQVFLLDQRDKQAVLAELADGPGTKLIFARTRAFAEDLAEMLEDRGIRAVSLHGDLSQARRTRNLERVTSGRANVLVATDVAARGIHVDDITLVIQADAPDEYKTYLHRAGRTGRAGKAGVVVTLVPFARRRRTEELLKRADIDALWTEVRPGDDTVTTLAERSN